LKIKDEIIVDFVLANHPMPKSILKTILKSPLHRVNVEVQFIEEGDNGKIEIPSAPIEVTNKLKDYIKQSKKSNIGMGTVIEKFDKELKRHKIDLPALPKMIQEFWNEQ
jgi:hypothetical protein